MKNIRDFLFGSSEEKAAAEKLKTLSGKDLGYDEGVQRDNASSKVLSMRMRQVASATGAAVLIGAGAYSAFYEGEKPPMEPTVEIAPESAPQPTTVEQKELKKFTVGPFEFVQDAGLSDESFERCKDLLTRAYPILEKYLPMEKVEAKQISLKKHPKANHAEAHYGEGAMLVGEPVSDGLFLHEFVHLLHGKRDLYYDLVEEGLATGLSIMGAEAIGAESWDRTLSLQMNEHFKNYLPVPPDMPYANNPNISTVRNEAAGYFWIDIEKAHPGAIRQFHETYYKYLEAGANKKTVRDPGVLESLMKDAGLEEVFKKQVKTHTIAQSAEAVDFSKPRILAYYTHYSNDHKRQLIILSGIKDGENTMDKVLQQTTVEFTLENLDTGKKSELLASRGGQKVVLNLDDPAVNKHFLKDTVGEGTRYKIHIKLPLPSGEILEEDFEFDYL